MARGSSGFSLGKTRSYSAFASSSDHALVKLRWQPSQVKGSPFIFEHRLEGEHLLLDLVRVMLPGPHRVDDARRREEALIEVVRAVPVACHLEDAVALADHADVHA